MSKMNRKQNNKSNIKDINLYELLKKHLRRTNKFLPNKITKEKLKLEMHRFFSPTKVLSPLVRKQTNQLPSIDRKNRNNTIVSF